jgi:hypothetical protein
VAPEIIAGRVRIDQQGLGDLLGHPAAAQEDHRVDAVGLALGARTPVSEAQFAQLGFG